MACVPLAGNLFPESLQSLVSVVSSPTLSLTFLPPSHRHSCDYIGPTWRTQHTHPIPKSLTYSHLQCILPYQVNTLTGFPGLGCGHLWGPLFRLPPRLCHVFLPHVCIADGNHLYNSVIWTSMSALLSSLGKDSANFTWLHPPWHDNSC